MQVSSSSINPCFVTLTSNRFRRISSEPCSTTTTSAAATYSRSVHNNNSLSFLTSQRNVSSSFTSLSTRKTRRTRRTRVFTVTALFERFTERSIKTIVYATKEAKSFKSDFVYAQHIMLGLIAEADETNRSQNGFLDSPVVTLEKARVAVFHLNDSTDYARDAVPFSLVQSVCLKLLLSIPNHWSIILVAIIKVDDGSSARILYRLETNPDQLAAVAYSIIQKEIARDGRELGYQSNGMHNKSISKKRSNAGSATNTKEKTALSQFCVVLTARASLGLIDPVICREVEVQ